MTESLFLGELSQLLDETFESGNQSIQQESAVQNDGEKVQYIDLESFQNGYVNLHADQKKADSFESDFCDFRYAFLHN